MSNPQNYNDENREPRTGQDQATQQISPGGDPIGAAEPIDQNVQPVQQSNRSRPRKPIRLWPGVTLAALMLLAIFVVPIFVPEMGGGGAMLSGAVGGLLIALWWLFFSRAPWIERLGAIVLAVVAVIVTKRIVHPSIAGGGMGMLIYVFAIPVMTLGLVAAAVASRRLTTGSRRLLIAAGILLGCGVFTLVRTGGITAEGDSDIHFRWSRTPEELLLAQAKDESVAPAPAAAVATTTTEAGSWPGFRGANRDGIVHGVRIDTDWTQKAPVQIWRQPIGPAWSSFAVLDNFAYTQEQRGDDEVVSCYDLSTGKPVWRHRDAVRFYESNAGAGPRGTPTLNNGRVYTLGGTGIVNALDARNGSVIWSHNAATETKTKTPAWGFSGSPLVVGDVVIVAAASSLAAYDAANGNPRWFGATNPRGYSSPHLATIGGVTQVLLMNGDGVIGVAPADGKILWQHAWSSDGIVQPAMTADGDLLLGSGSGMGSEIGFRRIGVAQGANGWTTSERWTSEWLNPYFSDFVVHKDHAYGFEGSSLGCVDLKNKGERKWKGGKYGHGQLVLLADQDMLLVLSEAGELALVKATPDQFTEVARFKAIEGKTWNHPVLVKDILLVRNAEEMAAFRLSLAKS